jgi:hypothetical protein
MARKRSRGRQDRDPGPFVAIPHLVLDSPGYRACTHTSHSLLLEIARQFNGNNNGKLVITPKYLSPRGWRSNDVITRAKAELLAAGLIFETRKGARPNRASWYALTWHPLQVLDGLDISPAHYPRGAYMRPDPKLLEAAERKRSMRGTPRASSIPSGGIEIRQIRPSDGQSPETVVPWNGAMRADFHDPLDRSTVSI